MTENAWAKTRREKREQRIKEIIAEWKCTQKVAYRILHLEETCESQRERLAEVLERQHTAYEALRP